MHHKILLSECDSIFLLVFFNGKSFVEKELEGSLVCTGCCLCWLVTYCEKHLHICTEHLVLGFCLESSFQHSKAFSTLIKLFSSSNAAVIKGSHYEM